MPVTDRLIAPAPVILTSVLAAIVMLNAVTITAQQSGARGAPTPQAESTGERVPKHWKILLGEGQRMQTFYVTFVRNAEDDGYGGTFSNPARGVVDRPMANVYYGEIAFTLGENAGEYRATLSPDGTWATGAYRAGDRSTPVRMERVSAAEAAASGP